MSNPVTDPQPTIHAAPNPRLYVIRWHSLFTDVKGEFPAVTESVASQIVHSLSLLFPDFTYWKEPTVEQPATIPAAAARAGGY